MNDLLDFFKKQNRKRRRGPVKTACTYKGPAVTPTTTRGESLTILSCTYYIQRTIPLVVILGSQYKQTGPAVNTVDKPANDNTQ